MRWINRTVALAAVLALSAVSAWAQAKECNDEFKTATYSKWYDNRTERQDVAYEAAVEYFQVCPNPPADDPYAKALKSFKEKYEALKSSQNTASQFEAAVKAKNYADQIRFGKQLTASGANAENAVIYIVMAGAGLGDANLLADASQAAKKAIDLIELGKPFTPAYQTKDQALAAMNYVIAKATMKTSPTDAIPIFVKALKYNSDLRKSPVVYNELATAYGEGPVEKYAKEYKAHADAGKSVDSPEVKLAIANLNQALDRQIDAFARAAAASTTQADKKQFLDVLAAVYKDRNKKDPAEGELNSLVASALSTPVPDAPAPITSLPQASGPAPNGGMPGSTAGSSMPTNGGNVPSNASSTAGRPAATGTGSSTTSKPATSPSPKPKPRRANHRRGH